MKLVLPEPKYMKDSIAIMSELVSETRFKISSSGITAVAVDPANVAMIIFKLLSSCFSEFDIKEEVTLGLNLNNLKQILRRVESSDVMTLETDESVSKLKITVQGKTTRRFAIPILEMDEKDKKEPELEFPVEITMPASTLSSAIDDADVVADSVTFVADTNKFRVVAEGDLNNVEVEIAANEEVTINNTTDSTIKAKYSLEYLKKMILGSKISDVISIGYNKDYPIKLNFVAVDKMSMGFVLAPRVETD
ncbi:MAG: proliferating cell nuclear antigen (pcna) [Candidatus Woesearchaeota archaeon]